MERRSSICSIIDSDNEILPTKNSIIWEFDEQIKNKKENFLMSPKLQYRKEQIQIITKNIKSDIKKIEQIISDLLDRQKEDYLQAFSQFMDSIRSSLKSKLEEMEKKFEKYQKNYDIRIANCEREFFQNEAMRLNNMVKQLKGELEDKNLKNKLLSSAKLRILFETAKYF